MVDVADEILYESSYLPDIIHCWLLGNLLSKHSGIIVPTRLDIKKKELYIQNPGSELNSITYIPDNKRKNLVYDLLDGLYGLQHYNLVHYKLSIDNVYIDTQSWTLKISGLEHCTYDYCLSSNIDITYNIAIVLFKLWNFTLPQNVLDAISNSKNILELGKLLYPDYSPPITYSTSTRIKECDIELQEVFEKCISIHTSMTDVCKKVAQQTLSLYDNLDETDDRRYMEFCLYLSLNLHKIYVNPMTLSSSDEDNSDLLSEDLIETLTSKEMLSNILKNNMLKNNNDI